jgi:transposase-like protein
MIDFSITDLLDDAANTAWLEQHLHPNGLHCPHCGSANRRFFRQQAAFDAYRCRDCAGYYTILTSTAFAKTQQSPEVHCNTCQGWGAALRTFLRAFRGVHKAYLVCYVAMFEALANAKRITPNLVRRMCYGKASCT